MFRARNLNKAAVNVLGQDYIIIVKNKHEDPCFEKSVGYCNRFEKQIVVLDTDSDTTYDEDSALTKSNLEKEIIRHELIHAFVFESGLAENSFLPAQGWAMNEEMIDWFAIQIPKICDVFFCLEIMPDCLGRRYEGREKVNETEF